MHAKMPNAEKPGITRETFAIAFTLMIVSIFGLICFLLAPHAGTANELALASEILIPSREILNPKPETRFVYVALVLGLPIAALASALVARNLRLNETISFVDLGLFAIAIAGVLFTLSKEPLLPSASFSVREAMAAALGGVLAALASQKLPRLTKKSVRIAVTVLLCVAGTALVFGVRVFGVADVATESPHLGAYLYSINQIRLGGTCLADVVTQYGCYGELYKPLFSHIHLSVVNLTLVNAAIQSAALCAVFVGSAFLISNPLNLIAASAWATLYVLRLDPVFFDVYYQYTPLRFLFPALSLLLAIWWCKESRISKAAVLGVFSAIAIFNNLDSGAVVAVALGALVLLTGVRGDVRKTGGHAMSYALALIAALVLMREWLSFRSGRAVDLSDLGLYAKIFAGSGFMMLPTPAFPSTWMVAALAAVASAAVYGLRVMAGEASARDHLLAYVTILGIGLLSYYLGRSHPYVLILCIWPFVIAAFALLDGITISKGRWGNVIVCTSLGTAGFLLFAAGIVSVRMAPELVASAKSRWSAIAHDARGSPTGQDLAFIKASVRAGEDFEVLAPQQAVLYSELDKRSKLPGPGVAEILLKPDADKLVQALLDRGPQHLFLGRDLLERQPILMNTSSWLALAMPELREKYALQDWSPGGRLMHLVRKPFAGNDLFGFEPGCTAAPPRDAGAVCYAYDASTKKLVGPDHLEFSLPFDIATIAPKGSFRIGLVVVPDYSQQPYATILSSHCCDFEGLVIHALPSNDGQYVLTAGDGSRWVSSTPFHLKAWQPNHLLLDYRHEQLTLQLDGREVVRMSMSIPPSRVGLTLGDWFARSRTFAGQIEQAWYVDH